MKLKDLLLPFILLGAGLAFILVAFLVFSTNGKNKRLIASKIKIGAFLLSFTWFVSGCKEPVTCYMPPEAENSIQIQSKSSKIEEYNKFVPGDTVFGYVHNATFDSYSYDLVDSSSKQVRQNGNIVIDSINYNAKYFHLILNSSLEKGTYLINYIGLDSLLTTKTPISSIKIYIK